MSKSHPLSSPLSISHTTTIVTPHGKEEQLEQLAIETPYTIALNDETIGSSMVLPVGLEEFGVGFLFGQGYIKRPEEVKEVLEERVSLYQAAADYEVDTDALSVEETADRIVQIVESEYI